MDMENNSVDHQIYNEELYQSDKIKREYQELLLIGCNKKYHIASRYNNIKKK